MPVERRGQVTRVETDRVNGQPEELAGFGGRRQPSLGGTSRMNREVHVRICERLGVKFPGATRRSARDLGPCHCLERTASPPADPRLCELPPRRPHSRRPGEGHAEPAASRAEAQCELNRDFHAAPGGSAPSVLLATGCVEPRCRRCALLDRQDRNHRPWAPGCRPGRGMRPKRHCGRNLSEAFPWVSTEIRAHRPPAPPPRNQCCRRSPLRNVAPHCRFGSGYGQASPLG
jgi:hypothetical protein